MKQTEEIKAIIREMMAQEMENYKEAASDGDADETASPVGGLAKMLDEKKEG